MNDAGTCSMVIFAFCVLSHCRTDHHLFRVSNMPDYSFQCASCQKQWVEKRSMVASDDPATCPYCTEQGDFRIILPPRFILEKPESFEYKLDKGLGAAREERQEHQRKFGSYDKYAGNESIAERRQISGMDPDEDVKYIGNIGDRKEDYDAVAESGAEGT